MSRFRRADEADLDVLVELMGAFYAGEGYPFAEAEARPAMRELVREPRHGGVWLAELDGRAVGYLAVALGYSLEFRGRDAFVDELFIEAAHRGRGLGSEALEVAERFCRESGVRALHLEVERENPKAQELYRRSGYSDHDRYLMTKRLG